MRPGLRWLPGRFGVYRLEPGAALPPWAGDGAFTTVSRSAAETSVLCAWHDDGGAMPAALGPLRCLVLDGPLDFALTGIIAGVTAPLAQAGISVFSVATYDTYYLLVDAAAAERAAVALARAGYLLRDE